MSVFSGTPDPKPVFEVTIYEEGAAIARASFDTLGEAETFAETWTEQVPAATFEIDDRSQDHTAWEAVAADTALDSDAPDNRR